MQVEGPHTTNHGLEAVFGVGAAVAEGLGAVENGQRGGFAAEAPVPRHRCRRDRVPQVPGPVHKLQQRRITLVVLRLRLRPQHPRVAPRPREIPLPQLAEQLGQQVLRGLRLGC